MANNQQNKYSEQDLLNAVYDSVTTALSTNLAGLITGENQTYNRMMTMPNYNYYKATADGQVKASAGVLHSVTFAASGTVTAGVITIYDSLTETGTQIWTGTIQTALNPATIMIDGAFSTGCYIGYDGTIANVSVHASYL